MNDSVFFGFGNPLRGKKVSRICHDGHVQRSRRDERMDLRRVVEREREREGWDLALSLSPAPMVGAGGNNNYPSIHPSSGMSLFTDQHFQDKGISETLSSSEPTRARFLFCTADGDIMRLLMRYTCKRGSPRNNLCEKMACFWSCYSR